MFRFLLPCALLSLGLAMSPGCFQADVTVPDIPYASSPPPARIAKADPNDKADLLRENQELRQRVAWLEEDNARLERKQRGLAGDLAKIQADIDKTAAERDRYRRALER
jgi:hypothetical protein